MDKRSKKRKIPQIVDGIVYWKCSTCKQYKPESDYYKRAESWNGIVTSCKSCMCSGVSAHYSNDAKRARYAHIPRMTEEERSKVFKKCSKCGEIKPLTEFHYSSTKKSQALEQCKACKKSRKRSNNQYVYKPKTPEKRRQYRDNWWKTRTEDQRLEVRIAKRVYGRLEQGLRQQLKKNPRKSALVKPKIIGPPAVLLGCSISEFIKHIEQQWEPGMTWENYGGWHIDHIIQVSSFDLTDPEQQKKCAHYTNQRPLWAWDHLKRPYENNYKLREFATPPAYAPV